MKELEPEGFHYNPLGERITRLSRDLAVIIELSQETIPEELRSRLDEIELMLRGHIHQLEEEYNLDQSKVD